MTVRADEVEPGMTVDRLTDDAPGSVHRARYRRATVIAVTPSILEGERRIVWSDGETRHYPDHQRFVIPEGTPS